VRRIARTRLDDADECFAVRENRLYFDLWTANQRQLVSAGVRPDRIEVARICTICDQRFLESPTGWGERRPVRVVGCSSLIRSGERPTQEVS